MVKSLSDDAVAQLEQLARLKDKGIISDHEFEDAKRDILSGKVRSGRDSVGSDTPNKTLHWALVGVGVLLLLVALAFLTRGTAADDMSIENNIAEADLNNEVVPASLSDLCGSEEIYEGLKNIIFNQAREVYGGAPGPLNTLQRAVRLEMQVPTVERIDEELVRVDCSGHAIINLPPDVAEAFNGRSALEADLEYAVQPAADGSGPVLRVAGMGDMIASLASAASLAASRQRGVEGGAEGKTYNPSFDCGRRLTNVERMICHNEELAALDRGLSDRYFELKKEVSKVEWQLVLDSQRKFLLERGRCAHEECIKNVYVAQSRFLDRYGTGAEQDDATSTS